MFNEHTDVNTFCFYQNGNGAIFFNQNLHFMLWSGLPLLQIRITTQDVFQYMVKIIKQQERYVQKTL